MLHWITGLALIAVPILFNLAFFGLARAFEYPDILRKPVDHILKRFIEGGGRLVGLWYLFAFTALLASPLALLTAALFAPIDPVLANASGVVGVIAGLVQALGLLRWVFVVPTLAQRYHESGASEATRAAAAVTFEAFHQYAGVAVGEHLGYLFTAGWTVLLSLLMFQTTTFGALMGVAGILSAVGIVIGVFEHTGWKAAAAINAISYIVWSLWLIVAGVLVLLNQGL
jgi:hypothetical protein